MDGHGVSVTPRSRKCGSGASAAIGADAIRVRNERLSISVEGSLAVVNLKARNVRSPEENVHARRTFWWNI